MSLPDLKIGDLVHTKSVAVVHPGLNISYSANPPGTRKPDRTLMVFLFMGHIRESHLGKLHMDDYSSMLRSIGLVADSDLETLKAAVEALEGDAAAKAASGAHTPPDGSAAALEAS